MNFNRYIEGLLLSLAYYAFAIIVFSFTNHLESAPVILKAFFYPAEWVIDPFVNQEFELQLMNLFLFSIYFTWAFFCVFLDMIQSANQLLKFEKTT